MADDHEAMETSQRSSVERRNSSDRSQRSSSAGASELTNSRLSFFTAPDSSAEVKDDDTDMPNVSTLDSGPSPGASGVPNDVRQGPRQRPDQQHSLDNCMTPEMAAETFNKISKQVSYVNNTVQDPVEKVTPENAKQIYLEIQKDITAMEIHIEKDRDMFLQDYRTAYDRAKSLETEVGQLKKDRRTKEAIIRNANNKVSELTDDNDKSRNIIADRDAEIKTLKGLYAECLEQKEKSRKKIERLRESETNLQKQYSDKQEAYEVLEDQNRQFHEFLPDIIDFLEDARNSTDALSLQLLHFTLAELYLTPQEHMQYDPRWPSRKGVSNIVSPVRKATATSRNPRQFRANLQNQVLPERTESLAQLPLQSINNDHINSRQNSSRSRIESVGVIEPSQKFLQLDPVEDSGPSDRSKGVALPLTQQKPRKFTESDKAVAEVAMAIPFARGHSIATSRHSMSSTNTAFRPVSNTTDSSNTSTPSMATERPLDAYTQNYKVILLSDERSSTTKDQRALPKKLPSHDIRNSRHGSDSIFTTPRSVLKDGRSGSNKPSPLHAAPPLSASSPKQSPSQPDSQFDYSRKSHGFLTPQGFDRVNMSTSDLEVDSAQKPAQGSSESINKSRKVSQQRTIRTNFSINPEDIPLPASRDSSITNRKELLMRSALHTNPEKADRPVQNSSNHIVDSSVIAQSVRPSKFKHGSLSPTTGLVSNSRDNSLPRLDGLVKSASLISDTEGQLLDMDATSSEGEFSVKADMASNSASKPGSFIDPGSFPDTITGQGTDFIRPEDTAKGLQLAPKALNSPLPPTHHSTSEPTQGSRKFSIAQGRRISTSTNKPFNDATPHFDANSQMTSIKNVIEARPGQSNIRHVSAAQAPLENQHAPSTEEQTRRPSSEASTLVDPNSNENSGSLEIGTSNSSEGGFLCQREPQSASNSGTVRKTTPAFFSSVRPYVSAETRNSFSDSPGTIRPQRQLSGRRRFSSNGHISLLGITDNNDTVASPSDHNEFQGFSSSRAYFTNPERLGETKILETKCLEPCARRELKKWGERYLFSPVVRDRSASPKENGHSRLGRRTSSSTWSPRPSSSILTGVESEDFGDIISTESIVGAQTTLGDVLGWIRIQSKIALTAFCAHLQLLTILLFPPSADVTFDVQLSRMAEQVLTTPLWLAPITMLIQSSSFAYFATGRVAKYFGLERLSLMQWLHLTIAFAFLYATYKIWNVHNDWYAANSSTMREKVLAWREECWDLRVLAYLRWYLQLAIERQFHAADTVIAT